MRPIRVLIADDHEVVREGILALLRVEPRIRVCGEATNGREAVTKALKQKPDVVVMDIGLPEISGLAAARRISADAPNTRILIFTLHDSQQVLREVLESGARGYVLKSDAGRDLLRAVRALSRGTTFFSPRVSGAMLRQLSGRSTRGDASPLTRREREVLMLVAEGRSNRQVASMLGISPKTIDTHRTSLMRKLGFHTVHDVVRYAIRQGLIRA